MFLESRYRKLVRDLPQTILWCHGCGGRWPMKNHCRECQGFGKLSKDSVQELLTRVIQPLYRARDAIFHGAGREDIDVRMLGRGRPFVFELFAPRETTVDVGRLHERVNERYAGRIEVAPFTVTTRSRVKFWKEGLFAKIYRAVAEGLAPLPPERCTELAGKALTIEQHTPQRVAHRRADLARTREVTVTSAVRLDATHLELELHCAHGTYVKEWISGDDGRTKPSLAELLGVPCACVELDVLEILTEAAEGLSPRPTSRGPA